MYETYDDLAEMIRRRFPERCRVAADGVIALETDLGTITIFRAAGDPDAAFVRMKLAEDGGRVAVEALGANFFWAGANGATLSLGPDGALYATERRPVDELCADGGLDSCLADFLDTIESWNERMAHNA